MGTAWSWNDNEITQEGRRPVGEIFTPMPLESSFGPEEFLQSENVMENLQSVFRGYEARARVKKLQELEVYQAAPVVVGEETVCNSTFGTEIGIIDVWESMTSASKLVYETEGPYILNLNANDYMPWMKLTCGDVYVGILDEHGNKTGPSMLINKDGIIFEAEFVDGDIQDVGRAIYANGDFYIGKFTYLKWYGKGLLQEFNGSLYKGDFVDGQKHGVGHESWPSGVEFTGEYLRGNKHGKGTFNWTDGSVYKGDLSQNMLEGYGEYYWSDCRKFQGYWKNNKIHGSGKFVWPDGRRYDGEYEHDKKHGYGVFHFKDGRKFEGNWKYGRMDGQGIIEKGDGRKRVGIWNKG